MNRSSPSWGRFCVEKHVKFGKRRFANNRRHCTTDRAWISMESIVILCPYASKEPNSKTSEGVSLVSSTLNIPIFALKATLDFAILWYVWISEIVLMEISAWKNRNYFSLHAKKINTHIFGQASNKRGCLHDHDQSVGAVGTKETGV